MVWTNEVACFNINKGYIWLLLRHFCGDLIIFCGYIVFKDCFNASDSNNRIKFLTAKLLKEGYV